MGLFSFLISKPDAHPELGKLARSGGAWVGRIVLPGAGAIDLKIAGTWESPGPTEVALALELKSRYESLKPTIERALFEHYEPYREAVDAGKMEVLEEPFPDIASPAEVWAHVSLAGVSIERLGPYKPMIEIAFETFWDVEHTVGARFTERWEFIELCGSV